MFTNNKAKYFGDNKVLIDAACLSGDTKPTTGVANGSMTLEMDTGKLYAFDEANSEWLALSAGGGGGGGGAEPLIINVVDNAMDKTFGEIRQAFDNGRTLLVAQDESYDDTTGLRMSAVINCYYSVTGGEYPSASGGVSTGSNEYSVSCVEAPYTLDALDALYPHMAD